MISPEFLDRLNWGYAYPIGLINGYRVFAFREDRFVALDSNNEITAVKVSMSDFYKDPTISRERKARTYIRDHYLELDPLDDYNDEGELIAPGFLKLIEYREKTKDINIGEYATMPLL